MSSNDRKRLWVVAAVLAACTLASYLPLFANGFVDFDDDVYITKNVILQRGLTLEGLRWAFTTSQAANWHPLTWLSLMLDTHLFGPSPLGIHAVNLALHVTNAVLLLFLLYRASGALAPSTFVAAVFALHPTHVESVAWAVERKDVLSTLFWFLALASWVRYGRGPGRGAYAWVALWTALGLMSKPMVVTLPFTLLLFDLWPLGRARFGEPRFARRCASLVLEKLPLFVLVAASGVATWMAQSSGGAMTRSLEFPLGQRVANAIVSYAVYLWRFVWPTGLAAFYPHPHASLAIGTVAGAAAVVLALSGLALTHRAKLPALFSGWFWFAGTLVPVIGITQVGLQANADRYTYIPYVGLAMALAWSVEHALAARNKALRVVRAAAVAALGVCAVLTARQVGTWRDTPTLFEHALAVTRNNFLVHNNLGDYLNRSGHPDLAIPHLVESLRLEPDFVAAANNLGSSYFALERYDEAERLYRQWLARFPRDPVILGDLATVRFRLGDLAQAIDLYERSIALRPERMENVGRLVDALLLSRDFAGAAQRFAPLVERFPDDPIVRGKMEAIQRLGVDPNDVSGSVSGLRGGLCELRREIAGTLVTQGKVDEAILQFQDALRWVPDDLAAHVGLAMLLTHAGRAAEAIPHYALAVRLDPNRAELRNNYGYALFLNQQYDVAVEQLEAALRLDPNDASLRANLERARARRDAR